VALEMSRQISNLGERVALLTLFDAPAPGAGARLSDTALIISAIYEIARQAGKAISFDPATFDAMQYEKQLEQLVFVLRENSVIPPNVELQLAMNWVRGYLRGQRARLNSLTEYRPESKYSGPVVLFRAAETWNDKEESPSLGWDRLCVGPLNAYSVPGDHVTMLQEPAATSLSASLKRCLEETDSMFGSERGCRLELG